MSKERRTVKISDVIEALSLGNLLTSVNGRSPCDAVMSMYTGTENKGFPDDKIAGITYNSKEVKPSMLFVCKGAHFKDEYLEEAINRGASCYVREGATYAEPPACDSVKDAEDASAADVYGGDRPVEIKVSDIRKAMPLIAKTYYGDISNELCLVGITGTKGKSTTAYYMRSILDEYMEATGGKKSAICSGIDNYDGVIDEESHLTSPEIMELYEHMYNAISSGITHMTMEVSSQALKYDRVDGVTIDAGAFLNIGTDHISDVEHPNFNDYFESKLRIFALCRRACYSLDSDHDERIAEASKNCPDVITFSSIDERANVFGYDITSDEGRVSLRVRGRGIAGYEDFDEELTLGTFGTINSENALAAVSLAALCNVPFEHIRSGLAKAKSPGRMEVFRSSDGRRLAIVDYAHNQLSYEKFFETIREEFPGKEIIIVFGSAGGKAFSRREELGTIAGANAKYSIITEEDYGEEDLMKICREIEGYVKAAGGACEIIPDRKEAIRKAISMMDDDTILFIPGKGRESRMKRGIEYVDVETDVEIVNQYL